MLSAHKLEFLVQPLSGLELYGYVVIRIPEDQFLRLKAEFPDRQWAGQDPKVNEAIKEGITKEEREEIAKHLKLLPRTEFQIIFRTPGPRYVDEAKENPSFEMNGKKFWMFGNS